jgi:DNA-binding MarR family transcriptional regulator
VHAISEITGIHTTDIRCLEFLSEVSFATAGDLAKITGLTTGAVTAVIDRLENAGFVKREADSNDRRKVIIRLIERCSNNIKPARDLFINQIPKLLSGYKTEELKLITDWNTKIAAAFLDEIEKLRASKRAPEETLEL